MNLSLKRVVRMQPEDECIKKQLQMLPKGTSSNVVTLANHSQIHWFECGQGPPVVLIHGFPSLPVTYAKLVKQLCTTNRVILPHLRGYGPSRAETLSVRAYRLEEVCSDLELLLDHLDIRQVRVIGHDWGAAVSWHLALSNHAGRVGSLTILNAILPPRYFFHRLIRSGQVLRSWYMILFQIPRVPEWLFRRLGTRGFAALIRYSASKAPKDLTEESALAYKASCDKSFGGVHYYRAAARRSAPDEVPLRIPAQIIYGLDDPALGSHLVSPSLTQSWAPQLELHPLTGVGHWPHIEATDKVTELLLQFWERQT